jgi:hypothetical protein
LAAHEFTLDEVVSICGTWGLPPAEAVRRFNRYVEDGLADLSRFLWSGELPPRGG